MVALRGRYAGPTNPREQWPYAQALARARTVVPPDYQNRPGDLLGLMAHAMALDIPLSLAWTHLHFNADGKGGMTGILMHGLLIRAGHRVEVLHADDTEVRMQLHRVDGQPGGQARWTIREAMRAELLVRTNWRRYPGDMLWWRCLARLTRRWAPDVVMGLGYVPDELENGVVEESTDPAADTPEPVDADGSPLPRTDVMDFLADIDTLPWAKIRPLMKKAADLGILGAYAGTVDGVRLTVEDVIVNAADAAQRREAAAGSPPPPPEVDEPARVGVPSVAVADLAPDDGQRAWCGCRLSLIIETGNHDPGTDRPDRKPCPHYVPPFTPQEPQ